MKLKYMLSEIGDRIQLPPNLRLGITEHAGSAVFLFNGISYHVSIRLIIKQGNKCAMSVDFNTDAHGDNLTNQHQALRIMSYVVGIIEEFVRRYNKKYSEDSGLEIVYIKYNPKSETDDISDAENFNRRDKLYKAYISKFCKKYESTVQFDNNNGTTAKFTPHLIVK